MDVPRYEVLLYDTTAGTSRRASLGPGGALPNDDSNQPAVSADGRYVAFLSDARNLVGGDTNGVADVFVRDLRYGLTNRVSRAAGGAQADDASFTVAISADGGFVAFDSVATNLVSGDTNDRADVFIRSLSTGTLRRVSRASNGGNPDGFAGIPTLSADGRYVAFASDATNLVSGDTNGAVDVYVRDLQYGNTYRVSVGGTATQANGHSTGAYLSADGRYVAFTSAATNLVSGDTNTVEDAFVRDRWSRTTVRANLDTT